MNPRRVAITAAALFGTVILVGGVIATVAGFEMREASVPNADVLSAATAVTAITKAALPDGSQAVRGRNSTRAPRGGERL